MRNNGEMLQQLSCPNLDILRGKCYRLLRNAPWKCWCLGVSKKPKRCYKVSESVFKCSQDHFVLEVSLLVVFCRSQFSGWCSGQPLVLARGQHGRPGCDLCTLPWWGSLRFVPKCDWCRSLEGRRQGRFSGHCLAWSLGVRHLGESQHVRHFWWPEASSHQESLWGLLVLVSSWWKRGQKECFILHHRMCLEFPPGIKCVGLPHHMWLHLLVMLNLRKTHPEPPNKQCLLQCLEHSVCNTDSDFKGFGFLVHFSESFCYLSWKLIAYW